MKRIFFIMLMASVLSSCDKFLDVKPAGKLIPQSGDVASFDKLLNNTATISYVYQNNNSTSCIVFLGDDIEMSNNQADYSWKSGNPNIDCYYAHVFKRPYNNPASQDYFWNSGFYKAAEYFNSCIDGVNSVRTPAVERQANETIAQARVARAWGYFYAVLGYGPVYKPGGDNSRKTIPYRVSSDVMSPMEDLSTTQEVFNRVLSEIHNSLPYIPENTASNTRFGKVQTYSFLAHYHLFTQKYDSVAYYADKALVLAAQQQGGMDNLFYDMNKFSWAANVSSNPDLRASTLINTTQGTVPLTATYNREICLYRTSANTGQPSAPSTYPSAEFLSLLDASTDLRCEYFFFEYNGYKTTANGVTYNDGRKILNFQVGTSAAPKMARTSGYTYPELLLMRAEGRARTGDLGGALSDLNYLRKFRHKTGTIDLASMSQDATIQEVINERRRELPTGSPKRFFDLKRFSLESGKTWCKPSITHVVKGVSYTQNVDSDFFVLPISNDVLRWNPQWGIPLDSSPWSSNK